MAKRDRRQLALLEVETDPSRLGTVRSRIRESAYSTGFTARSSQPNDRVKPDGESNIPDRSSALLAVLLHAREVLCRDGWVRGEFLVDRAGAPRARVDGDPWTLVQALWSADVSLARWEARLLLQRIAGHPNLIEWNAHPNRESRDVELLLDKAIRELGGTPPRVRIRGPHTRRHGGGWVVTTRS